MTVEPAGGVYHLTAAAHPYRSAIRMKIFQTISTWVSMLATIVMAGTSIIMLASLKQNTEAIAVAGNALELQRKEFTLRNRPIVDLANAEFDTEKKREGVIYPRSVKLTFSNLSDIPAKNIRAVCSPRFRQISCLKTVIELGAIGPNSSRVSHVFLTQEIYDAATNTDQAFQMSVEATYDGFLDNTNNSYGVRLEYFYDKESKSLLFRHREMW